MKRTLLTLALLGVLVLACVSLIEAKPDAGALAGAARAKAARTGHVGPEGSPPPKERPPAKAGKELFKGKPDAGELVGEAKAKAAAAAGRHTVDPLLLKPIKVAGDKNTFAAIHPAPVSAPNAASKNWNAPKRAFKLQELTRKASTAKNTKSVPRVGVRKPSSAPARAGKSTPKTGAIPRPTGVRPKFNKASKSNANILAFGKGAPVKYGAGGAVGPAADAAAAGAKATAKGAKKSKAGSFIEMQAFTGRPALVKPIIDPKVVPLPDLPAKKKRSLDHLAPCPANSTSSSSFLELEADSAHEAVVVVEDKSHQLVEAEVVGELSAGDVKLPSGLVVTAAQIDQMTKLFATSPTPRVFYHWGDYQASIRWGRNRKVDRGEIEWLNTQNGGMAAGGGFYLAQDPKASYGYGPVPCYIFTPANALIMDNNQTPIVAVLKQVLVNADKAVLGQYIPFIHSYAPQNGWWVTHHPDILANIRCGNAIVTPDPLGAAPSLNPTVNIDTAADVRAAGVPAGSRYISVHFDQLNGQVVTARPVATQYDAHVYLQTMIDDKWDDPAIATDVQNASKWVQSFFVLMQYIDGLSLVRAKKVFPSDPWQAFEPNHFGPFLDTFNAYVKRRQNKESIGIATQSGTFGDGTNAAAWATKMVDVVLPRIYAELSAGAEMSFRHDTVRAGGPVGQDPNNLWTTGSFVATAGQVATMQKNPYLSVESQAYTAGGDPALVLADYWYPDPLRFSGVASRITPELQAAITASGKYDGPNGAADLAAHTPRLMHDLLVDMFKGYYGKQACSPSNQYDFAGALQSALSLVSIHPCSDFNGRSTRFFMLIAALEGCGTIPVSFMSDFDIVTQFDKYNTFMVNANAGYLQLKVAMLAELISSLANNAMAKQYQLPEWGIFLSTALKQFGTKQFGADLTDEENEMVRTRQFVPILDKWFGKAWPGRASA